MSINHPLLSHECATPFKCGACTGDAFDPVKDKIVPCEHYCHDKHDDREPRLPTPPDDGFFAWAETEFDNLGYDSRYAARERELVDA